MNFRTLKRSTVNGIMDLRKPVSREGKGETAMVNGSEHANVSNQNGPQVPTSQHGDAGGGGAAHCTPLQLFRSSFKNGHECTFCAHGSATQNPLRKKRLVAGTGFLFPRCCKRKFDRVRRHDTSIFRPYDAFPAHTSPQPFPTHPNCQRHVSGQ